MELGEPDSSGRRRPVPVEGSEFDLEVDMVVPAIGQVPDTSLLEGLEGLEWTSRGTLKVDSVTLETTRQGVFAGGDLVTGPATAIEAVAAGKRAAESIHRFLRGEKLSRSPSSPSRRAYIGPQSLSALEKASSSRPSVPLRPVEARRGSFALVEEGLTEETARKEAGRCLRCDLCAGHGLCQMVCEEMGIRAIRLSETKQGRLALTDFLRPAAYCIGCGSCVQVCPHHNITMEDRGAERRIFFCGTEIARLPLESCEACGKPFAPRAYLDYLRTRVDARVGAEVSRNLCPQCARRIRAVDQAGGETWIPGS
jgi:NADH-quinone oxidoreductase subunit F